MFILEPVGQRRLKAISRPVAIWVDWAGTGIQLRVKTKHSSLVLMNAAYIHGANSGSSDGFSGVEPWANFSN
jgi:hypothetical protein